MDLVQTSRSSVSCHHGTKHLHWIHSCSKSLGVYCYYCQEAYRTKRLSTKTEPAFTVTGFSNWKKATTSYKEHECTRVHRDAVAFKILARSNHAIELRRSKVDTIHVYQKSNLINQLSALCYLLKTRHSPSKMIIQVAPTGLLCFNMYLENWHG